MPLLAALLWFAEPAPLDMPRAEAYEVRDEQGGIWLEDRYDVLDLWTAHAVLGRWRDDVGRTLLVAKLDTTLPILDGAFRTREQYAELTRPLLVKDLEERNRAIAAISPFEIPEKPKSSEHDIRGFRQVSYFEGTNETAIVCAARPEKVQAWYLVVWKLVEGDDINECRAQFEAELLRRWPEHVQRNLRSEIGAEKERPQRRERRKPHLAERELMREDLVHSVTNYPSWHVTSTPEFIILDDLPANDPMVSMITNELTVMRKKYAAAVPSPINTENVLAVARIYRNRDEFEAMLEDTGRDNQNWSAAFWCPQRREIIAHGYSVTPSRLLKVFRHEAFHQYLSYACSMMSAAPWLNEGFAEYFEDDDQEAWWEELDLNAVAEMLPLLMAMDYAQFYDGTDESRQLKYRLAWSIATFLEQGAPKVRFNPFKDVRKRYIESLLRQHDPQRATVEAFGDQDTFNDFIEEWLKFWTNM